MKVQGGRQFITARRVYTTAAFNLRFCTRNEDSVRHNMKNSSKRYVSEYMKPGISELQKK